LNWYGLEQERVPRDEEPFAPKVAWSERFMLTRSTDASERDSLQTPKIIKERRLFGNAAARAMRFAIDKPVPMRGDTRK
jgi:hypothetical protein